MKTNILNNIWRDKISLTEIKYKIKMSDITKTVKLFKWNWAGHTTQKQARKARDVSE